MSIADETHASVKSVSGKGITLSFETKDIDGVRKSLEKSGCNPAKIKKCHWGARCFYLHDPEGHRLEFWMRING